MDARASPSAQVRPPGVDLIDMFPATCIIGEPGPSRDGGRLSSFSLDAPTMREAVRLCAKFLTRGRTGSTEA